MKQVISFGGRNGKISFLYGWLSYYKMLIMNKTFDVFANTGKIRHTNTVYGNIITKRLITRLLTCYVKLTTFTAACVVALEALVTIYLHPRRWNMKLMTLIGTKRSLTYIIKTILNNAHETHSIW